MPPNPGMSPSRSSGKAEARHLVRNDQIARQRQLESAAEAHAVNGRDRRERRSVQTVEHGMNAFEEFANALHGRGRVHVPRLRV